MALQKTMKYSVRDVTKWLDLSNEEFKKIDVGTDSDKQLKQHMELIRAINQSNQVVLYVLFHDLDTNPEISLIMPLYFPEKACKLSETSDHPLIQLIANLFATTVKKKLSKQTVILECSPSNKKLCAYMKTLRNSIINPNLVVVFRYQEFFLAFKEPIAGAKWVEWNKAVLRKNVDPGDSHSDVKFRPLCYVNRASAIITLMNHSSFVRTIDLYEPVSNYRMNNESKAALLSQRCALEHHLYTMPCKDIIWKCKSTHSIKFNHVLMYGSYPYLGPDGYKWMLEELDSKNQTYAFLFSPLQTTVAQMKDIVNTSDFKRSRFEIDQEIHKTPYRQLQVFVDVTDKQCPWSLAGAIIYNYMASDLATYLSPSKIRKYIQDVSVDRFYIYAQAFMPMMRVRIIQNRKPLMLVQQDEQNGPYWVIPFVSNIWCPDQYIVIRAKIQENYLVPTYNFEYQASVMYNYMLDECNR